MCRSLIKCYLYYAGLKLFNAEFVKTKHLAFAVACGASWIASSQLGGRGSGGVQGSGGVGWNQIYSPCFCCQWQEGRRGLCLLWRGMWSSCRSLIWGCQGLPDALIGMQGKHSPEGFSLWAPHGLCWCFNPSTLGSYFQSSDKVTNKRVGCCKQLFLCHRFREDIPVVHAMRQQLSLPACLNII